jgi:Na+-transporting NADH:ubiquinone oxidoreductase subunit C
MYAAGLTIFCGLTLSLVAMVLKPFQTANIELEQKKNILATVMELKPGDDIVGIYNKRVTEYLVDFDGAKVDGKAVTDISVAAEYKKPAESRLYPVYEISKESDPGQVEFYVFPLYGYGLWDNIWGFVSFGEDLNTIVGVRYEHKTETAGLGARIATEEIQNRYTGKKIFDNSGRLVAVEMMKGEGNNYDNDPHRVDGMSGATITGKGLNVMLVDYLTAYKSFITSKKGSGSLSLN